MTDIEKPILLFKYGGNAMTNNKLKKTSNQRNSGA